jgi:hypothetical protein
VSAAMRDAKPFRLCRGCGRGSMRGKWLGPAPAFLTGCCMQLQDALTHATLGHRLTWRSCGEQYPQRSATLSGPLGPRLGQPVSGTLLPPHCECAAPPTCPVRRAQLMCPLQLAAAPRLTGS